MTHSLETRAEAERLLQEALSLLGEDHTCRIIDEPIDRALAQFSCAAAASVTHEEFHRAVAELVQHLYSDGLAEHRTMPVALAHDEAVFLLEHIYQGSKGSGYDMALVEGRMSGAGIEGVIHYLGESFKLWRRQLHASWVRTWLIGTSRWEVRREMAAMLLARIDPDTPCEFRGMSPARFANDPLALVEQIQNTEPRQLLAMSGQKGNNG